MFQTLQSNDRSWKIEVSQSDSDNHWNIIRTSGKTDGKQTTSVRRITAGKNMGKKNETTVYEQAHNEALALWTKQKELFCKSEYPSPMLAHTFKTDTMVFPCLTQPKLDGIRLLVYMKDEKISMLSRTGKSMEDNPGLENIKKHCLDILKDAPIGICLDGELYSHSSSFEDIVSVCRSKSTKPMPLKTRLTYPPRSKKTDTDGKRIPMVAFKTQGISVEQVWDMKQSSQIQFHIYDVIMDEPFKTRHDWLSWAVKESDFVKSVPVCIAQDIETLYNIHSKNVHAGYEGTMLRDINGKYEQKRSKTLQKMKDFREEEFEIVASKEGKGGDEGTVIFECILPNSTSTFWVRPKGSRDHRKSLFEAKHRYVGSMLTVIFQEYTSSGIPRFPIGKCLRDYE
jgi:ATP-dependent DNA ligase